MGEANRRGDYSSRKSDAIDVGRGKVKKPSKEELRKIRAAVIRELVRKNPFGVIG